ncbi:MAG: NAD-dependent epimerase/dehydratase family protein [Deltaproteobacteria bacterium]|nr:NAD-dependent epimerase/dehydratase family protein [Deltaproteobacteria bacterium]
MKIILFGATGMVGQGVLRECLLDPGVERVLAVGRSGTGQPHDKLRELVHADLSDLSAIEGELSGYDACFYCLGVSSTGMSEADYTRVTHDFTLAAARLLARLDPGMTFIYVSGAGTDASERGLSMWARVKGKTENAVRKLPFKATYMFRPGIIQPMHGIVSRTRFCRAFYSVTGPLFPVVNAHTPGLVTTTERVGKAMLRVAREGSPAAVLENRHINALAKDDARAT